MRKKQNGVRTCVRGFFFPLPEDKCSSVINHWEWFSGKNLGLASNPQKPLYSFIESNPKASGDWWEIYSLLNPFVFLNCFYVYVVFSCLKVDAGEISTLKLNTSGDANFLAQQLRQPIFPLSLSSLKYEINAGSLCPSHLYSFHGIYFHYSRRRLACSLFLVSSMERPVEQKNFMNQSKNRWNVILLKKNTYIYV